MKLGPKRSVLLLVAMALLALAVAPGGAFAKSCAKRGYSLEEKSGSTVLMSKSIRANETWEGPASRYYACSRLYGKRVSIGTYGLSYDGEVAFSNLELTTRYVAFAWGNSDNAGSVSDFSVIQVDLKTGKSRVLSLETSGPELSVSKIAIDHTGAVGWIDWRTENGVRVAKVWVSPSSAGTTSRQVATGPDIDPYFLTFGLRGTKIQLIWTTAVSGAGV